MNNCNNFLESVFGPNERIVIPERFGWYLWMQITRVSRLSMDFLKRLSRIKWIILSNVFGSPTLPIKKIVLKMRFTIFSTFVMTLHLISPTKIRPTKTSVNVSPTQTTLGVWPANRKPSDKWRVFWDPNDIWPSQWVAWRENDMWHPRPSCSPGRCFFRDPFGEQKVLSFFFRFWVALFSRVLC